MVYKTVNRESVGSGGYVASILVNGQVIQEKVNGEVVIPFETEYQIRLRNKTKLDCVAKVYIDEDCVTPESIIVRGINNPRKEPNFVDLDRPTTKPVKFKFVAVDSFDAVDAGKNRPNDASMGVIRVEFYPEKKKNLDIVYRQIMKPRGFQPHFYGAQSLSAGPEDNYNIEAGATVDGGYSSQQFTTSHIDVDWTSATVIRLVLKGFWKDEPEVFKAVPARHCGQCNAKRKRPSAQFCEMCGARF